MIFIACTLILLAILSTAESKCEDTVSSSNRLIVTDDKGNFKENVTSCARIIECYPGLCEKVGKNNGACCASCKAEFGTTKCINKASKCSPVYVIPFNEDKKPIESCDIIVRDYREFCAKDSFGGNGNACCKACKEAPKGTAPPPTMGPTPVVDPTPAPSPTPVTPETTPDTAAPSPTPAPTPPPDGACEDKLTEKNYLDVLDSNRKFVERVTTCKRLATCHRGLCENSGKPGGSCCQSCKSVGSLDCMNKASLCLPVYVIPAGSKKKPVYDCRMIVKDYSQFCAEDSFGGKGNSCCKACKEAPNPKADAPCVDSTTWKLGKGKKAKTCDQLKKKAKKMKQCCIKNKKGKGTSMRCQAACCSSCAQYL